MNDWRELEGKTVYIAGRMRGHENYNFPAFDAAADTLRKAGATPISPADLDRAHGFDPFKGHTVDDDCFPAFSRACIRRDLNAILDSCDAVLVIGTDYSLSKGVTVEVALAGFLELPVYYEEEMVWWHD